MQSIASLAPKQEAEGVHCDCSRPQIVMRMVDGGEKTKSWISNTRKEVLVIVVLGVGNMVRDLADEVNGIGRHELKVRRREVKLTLYRLRHCPILVAWRETQVTKAQDEMR